MLPLPVFSLLCFDVSMLYDIGGAKKDKNTKAFMLFLIVSYLRHRWQ